MSSWVRQRFQHLKKWREYAESIARAVSDIAPDSKVYVIGGVGEERITVLSDIDILIITPRENLANKRKLYIQVLTKAIDQYGLPWDAPIELHITSMEEAEEYLKHAKKKIEIKPE